jgi:hypothetical protein
VLLKNPDVLSPISPLLSPISPFLSNLLSPFSPFLSNLLSPFSPFLSLFSPVPSQTLLSFNRLLKIFIFTLLIIS